MPTYEFLCQTCGSFTLARSMSEAASVAACPGCGETACRVYAGVGIMTMGHALRSRVELGARPQVKRKEELSGVPIHAHQHTHLPRPWQAGH